MHTSQITAKPSATQQQFQRRVADQRSVFNRVELDFVLRKEEEIRIYVKLMRQHTKHTIKMSNLNISIDSIYM